MRRSRRDLRDEAEGDDEDDIPLHHKRPFGSGLKRKRVEFVRAQDADLSSIPATTSSDSDIGDIYASIVMPTAKSGTQTSLRTEPPKADETATESRICAICALPITTTTEKHEASLAHQVSLSHSHPPSALDRSRMGLRTLASVGWDPDARVGLGREGEGMRFPIKVSKKEDNLGVGATAPMPAPPKEQRSRPLSARERKTVVQKEKQRTEHLQREIFGSVDVEGILRGESRDTGLR